MLHWFISLKHYLINYINISIYQYNLCSFGLQFTSSFFIWLAIIEIDSYEALTDESHKKDGQDFLARSSLLIFTVLHIIFCYQLTSHILYYFNFSQLCQQLNRSASALDSHCFCFSFCWSTCQCWVSLLPPLIHQKSKFELTEHCALLPSIIWGNNWNIWT